MPALRLDNGEVLTEAAVILQYLANQKPESGLAPKTGTMERYRLMEWLNFVSSEIHKQFGPLFNPEDHAGMESESVGSARSAVRLSDSAAKRSALPNGRPLNGGRCLPLYHA